MESFKIHYITKHFLWILVRKYSIHSFPSLSYVSQLEPGLLTPLLIMHLQWIMSHVGRFIPINRFSPPPPRHSTNDLHTCLPVSLSFFSFFLSRVFVPSFLYTPYKYILLYTTFPHQLNEKLIHNILSIINNVICFPWITTFPYTECWWQHIIAFIS